MNIFDSFKKNMFDITLRIMGYNAEWTNSETSEVFTAKVHFNYPTPEQDLHGVEYYPADPNMEYKQGDFEGLKELADRNINETVTIDGRDYFVRSVNRKYDGDTLVAQLADA